MRLEQMIYTYNKYTVDGNAKRAITTGSKLTLEQLQAHVGGDIEVVALDNDVLMIVNELGLYLDLPQNIQASFLAKQHIYGIALTCDINAID